VNQRLFSLLRILLVTLALTVAAGVVAPEALADKVKMKDGRVLEGKILREGESFIILAIKIGTVESNQTIDKNDVLKIERDTPAPKDEAADKAGSDAKAKDEKSEDAKNKHTGATRVAILNFGAPSSWQGATAGTVGKDITADAFRRAIPMLEKDKVEVVVVRVNSGGGSLYELSRFHDVFEKEYKTRFRTVAWIESAISAAAMSPWVIEEYYFLPNGNMGACTGWSGNLVAVKGVELEEVLLMMEHASNIGKKDPRIMRSMQIQEPLSVDIDEAGNIVWRQDENGQKVLNPRGQVFTINAQDAVRYKFAKAIVSTKEELAKAMGLQEVEWVGQAASDFIDKNMRDSDQAFKRFEEVYQKYGLAFTVAEQLQDKPRRTAEVAVARRHLAELRRMAGVNANFPLFQGVTPEWFQLQEEELKKIAARP
jgi:hypothetical protein